jgi:hypothetical protein
MRLSRFILSCVVFITLLTVNFTVFAQPGNPGDPGDNPVPISGIELLLLTGGALGGYKIFKNKIRKT